MTSSGPDFVGEVAARDVVEKDFAFFCTGHNSYDAAERGSFLKKGEEVDG
jgi:hypothetical protein